MEEITLVEAVNQALAHELAADPFAIVDAGGHILSLVENARVVGVCALIRDDDGRFQLARMAVDRNERGKGYGEMLMAAELARARPDGASPARENTECG